jgi:hypothetical protein
VIIGFLGSSDRILKKYAEVYEDLGLDTVAMTPSFFSIFLGHMGVRGHGSRQVRKWCRRLQVKTKIVSETILSALDLLCV